MLLLTSASVLAACGGSSAGTGAAGTGAESDPVRSEVVVEGIAFEPETLTVSVGETVTWVNEDPVDHTVTAGRPGEQGVPGVSEGTKPKTTGMFDDALERRGSTFSFTFEKAGTYEYFCRVHVAMRGVITVE